jgi:hypothetical protein
VGLVHRLEILSLGHPVKFANFQSCDEQASNILHQVWDFANSFFIHSMRARDWFKGQET